MTEANSGKTIEQEAERDNWFVDNSINISLPSDLSQAQLLKALEDNRVTLENLKRQYWEAKSISIEDDRTKKMLRYEMKRIVNAFETIKNRLAILGIAIPLSELDMEHPEAAYRRYVRDMTPPKKESSGWWVFVALLALVSLVIAIWWIFN